MLRGRGGRTGGEIKFNSCGKKRERGESRKQIKCLLTSHGG